MPVIPTVPGSEIDVSTPTRAVRLDAGALSGPRLRGANAMAGAVEGVGEQFERVSEDIRKAREIGVAADVDLKMRTARQAFLESLRNDNNQDSWQERAQELAHQVQDDIDSTHENVSPEMRPQIDAAFKNWQGSLMVETQTMAHVQTVNRAWGQVKQDYEESLRDGHAEHAANLIGAARRGRIADPTELDALERAIPGTIAMNYIENGLQTNPKGTMEMLKSGASLPATDQKGKAIVPSKVLTPKQIEILTNTARTRTAAWQKNNFEQTVAGSTDPITGFVPEETIKTKMQTGEIDELTGRNFLAAQDRKLKADNAEKARILAKDDSDQVALLSSKIHDPTAWGVNPDVYAHELIADAASISNPALRQKAINEANHQLAAVKKTGETAERPIEKQIFGLMNEDRLNNGAMLPVNVADVAAEDGTPKIVGGLGLFKRSGTAASTTYTHVAGGLTAVRKMSDDEIKANFGEAATKDSVIESINVHHARLQEEMRQWFKSPEGQKATFEQANEHRQRIERPYVMDAVRATLNKRAPAAITTKEEYDALPPGAPFVWQGRVGYHP